MPPEQMPTPLAHLLIPQIVKRARDIEARLGPPQVGYLNVGEKTPYDPKGLIDKPADKPFDSRTPGGHILEGIGIMQRSGDPIAQKVARAFLAGGIGKTAGVQGMYRTPQAGQALEPNAPYTSRSMLARSPGSSDPIGFTESGEPIYEPVPPAAPQRPGRVLKLKRDETVGFDETGNNVDVRGRKLGYLVSPQTPMGVVAAPGRELPLRDLARRNTDAAVDRRDAFGAGALQRTYGPHLKALQDNFQDTGKEEFPPGYFEGMSKDQRKQIEDGVKALQEMERGRPA